MSTVVYVPQDTSALSLGAHAVAQRVAAEAARLGQEVQVVRNGSRGLFWLEPLVEVETPAGRMAYGPVSPADVASLFEAGWLTGGKHALSLGPTEAIPYLKRQERLCFARVGVIDPLNLDAYEALGGLRGLRNSAGMAGAKVVEDVVESGLRGRGGAAFPTGIKWRTVLQASGSVKYIVCNADEGDSGTFSDRMLMEGD
ncbi:MAG: formate dehydrogenase, partial [Betaproteobacteria bacterium]|nr:formate dehydrogenase [Betaproteobacteria bacterium]